MSLTLTQALTLGGNPPLPGHLQDQSNDTVLWLPLSSLPCLLSLLTVPHDLALLLAAHNLFIRVLIMGRRGPPKVVPFL